MIQTNDFERQVCKKIFSKVSRFLINIFKVEEITINVPWGHIACKWWGPKSVRPILTIHGWQDNASSFDPLIVQLPDHISYLAVDLPGHGLSSRLPDGMVYSLEIYFYTIMLICDHFRWEKVSLMGHSLGSMLSFLYAATYPNKCDMVIGLDSLRPYGNVFKLISRHFSKGLSKSHEADIRNREKQEPPSYTYDELVTKIKSGFLMRINEEAAPYLLARAVVPSSKEPNKYYFARDSRTKASPIPMMAHDILTMFAKNIVSPYCFMKTSVIPRIENQAYYNEIVEIMQENPQFEIHSVVGDHHIHLNKPNKISGILSAFISKYRPRQVLSKL